MNVLVTGCAGFIGSKVVELLIGNGHGVVGVDNLKVSYGRRLKEWRLGQLQGKPNFAFRRCDILNRQALEDLFRTSPVESVMNLAARAGVRQSLKDPWAYYDTNLTGALNLLEVFRKLEGPKFG